MSLIKNKPKTIGYTIIEVMIVIVILGAIASLAVPNYTRIVERQKCSRLKLKLKSAISLAQIYFAKNIPSVTLEQIMPDAATDPDFNFSSPPAISSGASISGQRKPGNRYAYICSNELPNIPVYCQNINHDQDEILAICDCNDTIQCSF